MQNHVLLKALKKASTKINVSQGKREKPLAPAFGPEAWKQEEFQ